MATTPIPTKQPITKNQQSPTSKLKSTTKIPKLNDLLNKKDEEEKPQEEEREHFGTDPFTFEDLKKHWNDFAEAKKAEGKDSEYMVLKQELKMADDTTVKLFLTNSVKEVIIDKFRSDLMQHLKTKLNNRNIKLETDLLEEEATKMIYTNKEKFDHLAEKKPIILKLKDRLGLDPDF